MANAPVQHDIERRATRNPFIAIHFAFESGFHHFRNFYHNILAWCCNAPLTTVIGFVGLIVLSCFLFPMLGRDFFPQVDAGQMRLHVRAPPGTRIEKTQENFAAVEGEIRRIVGNGQVDVILDNIGLPYSGINIALSDIAPQSGRWTGKS